MLFRGSTAGDQELLSSKSLSPPAVTRIRTEVAAATTQSTNHYTITARQTPGGGQALDLMSFEAGLYNCGGDFFLLGYLGPHMLKAQAFPTQQP